MLRENLSKAEHVGLRREHFRENFFETAQSLRLRTAAGGRRICFIFATFLFSKIKKFPLIPTLAPPLPRFSIHTSTVVKKENNSGIKYKAGSLSLEDFLVFFLINHFILDRGGPKTPLLQVHCIFSKQRRGGGET